MSVRDVSMKNEMEELFPERTPELVLDATHPYAAEVTKNIRKACEKQKFLIRGSSVQEANSRDAVYVERYRGSGRVSERYYREMFFLPQEARNCRHLQRFRIIRSACLQECCPFRP